MTKKNVSDRAKDNKTTRWLARRAFELRIIDAVDWEFIDLNPARALEVTEFVEWLAVGAGAGDN